MPNILPVSQLAENPELLSKLCREKDEPIYLTKDGYGDMVVMSVAQYEKLKAQAEASASAAQPKKERRPAAIAATDEDEPSGMIEKLPFDDVMKNLKKELDRQRRNRF